MRRTCGGPTAETIPAPHSGRTGRAAGAKIFPVSAMEPSVSPGVVAVRV